MLNLRVFLIYNTTRDVQSGAAGEAVPHLPLQGCLLKDNIICKFSTRYNIFGVFINVICVFFFSTIFYYSTVFFSQISLKQTLIYFHCYANDARFVVKIADIGDVRYWQSCLSSNTENSINWMKCTFFLIGKIATNLCWTDRHLRQASILTS